MIASISEEIARAANENRIVISPIPIGQPVFVVEKCRCSPLYAEKCCRAAKHPTGGALCCEPIGSDGRRFRCAMVYMRPFDYAVHSKKLGKTVFEKKLDALLAIKSMIQKEQH